MIYLVATVSFIAGMIVGLVPRWALSGYRVRQPIGSVTRTFEWPGKAMRIIDAEVLTPDAIDTAVRGD